MNTLQKIQKIVGTEADGLIGPNTLKAICNKLNLDYSSDKKTCIKTIQKYVGSTADGIWGPKTEASVLAKLGGDDAVPMSELDKLKQKYIDKPINITKINYKHDLVTQSELRSGKSAFGKVGCEDNLVNVKVPENYPLKYDGQRVKTIRIHKLVADRLEAALNDVINHYGEDIEKVAPGACVYDGSYNYRKTTGGSSYSVHSWGVAIDFDAANNSYSMHEPNARLSKPEYKPFLDIFEAHGFHWLGRRNDYDWMHGQFTNWG